VPAESISTSNNDLRVLELKEVSEGAPSGVAGKHQVRGTWWFLSTVCMCMKLVSFLVNLEGGAFSNQESL
jgi:hypothetical protein